MFRRQVSCWAWGREVLFCGKAPGPSFEGNTNVLVKNLLKSVRQDKNGPVWSSASRVSLK